jgi:hypothetical protein
MEGVCFLLNSYYYWLCIESVVLGKRNDVIGKTDDFFICRQEVYQFLLVSDQLI